MHFEELTQIPENNNKKTHCTTHAKLYKHISHACFVLHILSTNLMSSHIKSSQGMARVSETRAGRGYGYMRVRVRVEILLPASFKTSLCSSKTVKY